MNKKIISIILMFLLFSCKTSKNNCDAYGMNNTKDKVYIKKDTTKILINKTIK